MVQDVLTEVEGAMEVGGKKSEEVLLREEQVLQDQALRLLEASYRVGEDGIGALDKDG